MNHEELDAYCLGATLLGSGGGGNPKILQDFIKYLMSQYGDLHIISLEDLNINDWIVPIALIGAPLISLEKIPNLQMFETLYQCIQQDFPERKIVLMPAEIGGCNALTPLVLALKYQLPILDADLMGRAFPTLQMCKPAVLKQSCNPSYLADYHGNHISLHLNNLDLLETMVRHLTVSFGSSALIATFMFSSEAATNHVISGSISKALQLGQGLLKKTQWAEYPDTQWIGSGRIIDIHHDLRDGFLFGHVIIQNQASSLKINFQNEFLSIYQSSICLAASPNIIVILDHSNQLPLTTESLNYGLEVDVFILKAPEFWLGPEAFKVVDHSNHHSATMDAL